MYTTSRPRGQYNRHSFGRDYRTQGRRPSTKVSPTPDPPFGALVKSLGRSDIKVDEKAKAAAAITDCELVASFNWLDAKEPTILVPGGPPRWTPLVRPASLAEDAGTYLRDVNSARFPQHPMEPAIVAAVQTPAPQGKDSFPIDIVACGSTLGNLLRFVRDDQPGLKAFRMVAELDSGGSDGSDGSGGTGGTVFLTRRENKPDEVIHNIYGYGHTFPEAYTTWDADAKKSVSHQRLVRYRFGGLGLVVRFEVDGYIDKADKPDKADKAAKAGSSDTAELETLLAGTTISSASISSTSSTPNTPSTPSTSAGPHKVTVQHGGTLRPQSAVFDLKTRSCRKKASEHELIEQELPRLWVRQMPMLVLAYHDRGVFNDIAVHDMRGRVQAWEAAQQTPLQKLAALLRVVLAELKEAPSRKLEICYRDSPLAKDRLEFRQPGPGATDALSSDTQLLWAAWKGNVRRSDGSEGEGGGDDRSDGGSVGGGQLSDDESDDYDYNYDYDDDDFTACSAECGYCGRCTY